MAPLGGMPLARPLGELSPQATERALAVTVYPLRLRFAQPPLPKGEAMNTGKGIFWRMSASLRGKGPRKPKGFSWSVQGSLRGNRNPLRLVFFLPLFLLEKQKKKWDRSRKFAEGFQPSASFPHPTFREQLLVLHTEKVQAGKSGLHLQFAWGVILPLSGSR